MKYAVLPLFLIMLALLAGCAATTSQNAGEKPPRQAKRAKVVMYDSASRPSRDHIDIIEETQRIQKPYKSIALITCEGAAHEETEMTQAIIYRARLLGADAVIMMTPRSAGMNSFDSLRCVFRGEAVLYKTTE
jgi:hypothetical protein